MFAIAGLVGLVGLTAVHTILAYKKAKTEEPQEWREEDYISCRVEGLRLFFEKGKAFTVIVGSTLVQCTGLYAYTFALSEEWDPVVEGFAYHWMGFYPFVIIPKNADGQFWVYSKRTMWRLNCSTQWEPRCEALNDDFITGTGEFMYEVTWDSVKRP